MGGGSHCFFFLNNNLSTWTAINECLSKIVSFSLMGISSSFSGNVEITGLVEDVSVSTVREVVLLIGGSGIVGNGVTSGNGVGSGCGAGAISTGTMVSFLVN